MQITALGPLTFSPPATLRLGYRRRTDSIVAVLEHAGSITGIYAPEDGVPLERIRGITGRSLIEVAKTWKIYVEPESAFDGGLR